MNISPVLSLTLAAGLATTAFAATDAVSPGFFDLGTFSPPKSGGEFVEVNVNGSLLSMAAKIAAKQEPEAAELLKSIELVRVHVIGLDDSNRADIQSRIATLRTGLDAAGWQRVVTVQQKGEDVGVYTKSRGADALAGVVVTVLSGDGKAVFVNVVGDIQPERLAELGAKLHIEPLKAVLDKAGEGSPKAEPKK